MSCYLRSGLSKPCVATLPPGRVEACLSQQMPLVVAQLYAIDRAHGLDGRHRSSDRRARLRWGEQDGVPAPDTFSSANRACREQRVQDVAMLVSYRREVLADARSKGQEYFNYIRCALFSSMRGGKSTGGAGVKWRHRSTLPVAGAAPPLRAPTRMCFVCRKERPPK